MPAPETILFVGGTSPHQAALTSALREAGFAIEEAPTGKEALARLRAETHLLILAGDLPDMNRQEFCRKIKEDPALAAVLVLHLADHQSRPDNQQHPPGRQRDTDGYLLEPVDAQELLAHVRALLRLGRAETALQISEARLRDILDHAPVVAHVKDLDGRYLLVNRHWEKLFHFTQEQVAGKTSEDVHGPDLGKALHANDLRVIETGTPLEFEEVVHQDDGLHTYLSIKFLLADPGGRPSATCGISTDITLRKRAEEALRDSEALYHSLVESLPICLLRKNLRGRFTFANTAFCAAVKKPLAEIIGRSDFDFYPAELATKYLHDDRRVIETRDILEDIEEHQDPEGEKTYVQVLKAPLTDARGQVIGVQGIYWDITPRKRAEAELGRATAEFRVARRIQQGLFPRVIPSLPGLDIAVATFGFDISGASYPAEAIGGDYYDFVPLRDGSLGVAIGDVSGHGVGPALLMAEVRAFLRAFAQTETNVGAILGLVNRVLIPDIQDDRFITMLFARLDPRTRRFSYSSAGHQRGYILNGAGEVKHVLESTATPLGIFSENTFPTSEEIPLELGDLILLVTDGVADASAPDGTRFGAKRTCDLVRAYRREKSREIVENLYQAVRAFGQNMPQYDDITATVIKVTAPLQQDPEKS
jgi:sigma-B regulation protein RsbU (phosphoserine phosphatase)